MGNFSNEHYVTCERYEAAREARLPHRVHCPELSRDGNLWCALFGENLQEGVSGFGETPWKAMDAFDRAWQEPGGTCTYGVSASGGAA